MFHCNEFSYLTNLAIFLASGKKVPTNKTWKSELLRMSFKPIRIYTMATTNNRVN